MTTNSMNAIREVCGEDVPKTFEKFRDMKYNETGKWEADTGSVPENKRV